MSWLYSSAQLWDKWMKCSSFRKRWMISLTLIEWINEKGGRQKFPFLDKLVFTKWTHDLWSPRNAVSSLNGYTAQCPAERPELFHRPRHILQNSSCKRKKRQFRVFSVALTICLTCPPPSVDRLFVGKFIFHFLKIQGIRKWQPETLPYVNSVVFCLIIIPPSCSIFSIKFKCQELHRDLTATNAKHHCTCWYVSIQQ